MPKTDIEKVRTLSEVIKRASKLQRSILNRTSGTETKGGCPRECEEPIDEIQEALCGLIGC